jgi:hypothetical protein
VLKTGNVLVPAATYLHQLRLAWHSRNRKTAIIQVAPATIVRGDPALNDFYAVYSYNSGILFTPPVAAKGLPILDQQLD